jgi:hypothetical protein
MVIPGWLLARENPDKLVTLTSVGGLPKSGIQVSE